MPNEHIPNPHTDLQGWVEWKRRLIGGHAASTIVGRNKYQTLDQLYDLIVHGIVDPLTAEDEAFLEWRRDMEPNIAARYSKQTGRVLHKCRSVLHSCNPRLVASPDRKIRKDPKGNGQLEIKSRDPIIWNQIQLKGMPDEDWVQAQHYLMVCNEDKFSGLCQANVSTGRLYHLDFEPDHEFHCMLFQRIEKFLADCDAGIRPKSEQADPVRLPDTGGQLVTMDLLDDELVRQFHVLVQGMRDSKATFDQADEYRTGVRQALASWLLKNKMDVVEGFDMRIYYKEQKGRKSLDKKGLQKAHPEVDLAQFTKQGNPFRALRTFEMKPAITGDTNVPAKKEK